MCIATSATIVDKDNPDAARDFASRFFGVAGDNVVPVAEAYESEVWAEERTVPPAPDGLVAEILENCVRAVEDSSGTGDALRTVYRELSGNPLEDGEWPVALNSALSRNEIVFALNDLLTQPRQLHDLPQELEATAGRNVSEAEILSWLTLGAAAQIDGRPLLRLPLSTRSCVESAVRW